jgi:enolase
MTQIGSVDAEFILDSRGNPTVEVTIELDNGLVVRASSPSGASTGVHEAVELRDGDPARWGGKGVERALQAVRNVIAPALRHRDPRGQREIDALLVHLDGTPDRSHLGTNAMLATSVACARAAAASAGQPLWQYLARPQPMVPLPMVNILSGNAHAPGGMDVQDVMAVPIGATSYSMALTWACDVYRKTRELLLKRGIPPLVGDEGGFGTSLGSSEAAIAAVWQAIQLAGFEPGTQISIAVDVAASYLATDHGYRMDGAVLSANDLVRTYQRWIERYSICSIEDPFSEDAWDEWAALRSVIGDRAQVLGDDLIVTQEPRLQEAADKSAANAVLIKANQVGTLSEAIDVVEAAHQLGWRAVVSARSGETEDDWLADFAVATGAGQIKVGSVARSERLAKYNRLLRIAREADSPPYAGGGKSLPGVT